MKNNMVVRHRKKILIAELNHFYFIFILESKGPYDSFIMDICSGSLTKTWFYWKTNLSKSSQNSKGK